MPFGKDPVGLLYLELEGLNDPAEDVPDGRAQDGQDGDDHDGHQDQDEGVLHQTLPLLTLEQHGHSPPFSCVFSNFNIPPKTLQAQ